MWACCLEQMAYWELVPGMRKALCSSTMLSLSLQGFRGWDERGAARGAGLAGLLLTEGSSLGPRQWLHSFQGTSRPYS